MRTIQCEAHPFPKVRKKDVRCSRLAAHKAGAIESVSLRWSTAVCPVERAALMLPFEVDGLWQIVEHDSDVGATGRRHAFRQFQCGAQNSTLATLRRAFLCPEDSSAGTVDRNADAMQPFVGAFCLGGPSLDQDRDVAAIGARTHHAHAFAITPIEQARLRVDLYLLGRERRSLGNDHCPV